MTGSSFLKIDTFDIVSYNLEFFASNVIGSDGQEFGPIDDDLQIENVAKVMNELDADVYAVQEVSNDAALDVLISKISINGKTFDKTISPTWSYSFQAPDPQFPPQKLVVLYNTKTTKVKKTRVLFQKLFDDIRSGTTSLLNYPGGNSASFFSSGRLPYLVEIQTNIGGVKKDITIIDLHARANSGTDISKYNMRKYDIDLLKDSLDVYLPKNNIILLGDFNDDVDTSVIAGNNSSYKKFIDDTAKYNPLTLNISQQGAFSYLSSNGFLDHIIISNELTKDYIANSIMVFDPRNSIPNYVNTTSDHGPVTARFTVTNQAPTVVNTINDAVMDKNKTVTFDLNTIFDDIDSYPLTYETFSNNTAIATSLLTNQSLAIKALELGETLITLTAIDEQDNRISISFKIVVTNQLGVLDFDIQKTIKVKTYPNPVVDFLNISVIDNTDLQLKLTIYDTNGKFVHQQNIVNNKAMIDLTSLPAGMYFYTLTQNNQVVFKDKIIKK